MLYQIIIVIHVLLGIGIVGLILMQQGKGADAGAAFGSGGSGSVFGAQGSASFLSRSTAVFATLFFITSLVLAMLSGYQGKKTDIMDAPVVEQPQSDVPLSQKSNIDAAPAAVITAPAPAATTPAEPMPVTAVPAEPAIQEVE